MLKTFLATGPIGCVLAIYATLLDAGLPGSTEAAATSAFDRPTQQAFGQPAVPPSLPPAGQPIEVQLADGRRFTAPLDWHTDSAALWLRWQRGDAYILRPIPWVKIASVQVAGAQLAADELRAMVQDVRQDVPLPEQIGAVQKTAQLRALWPLGQPGATSADHLPAASTQQGDRGRVRWLDIEVQAANWDADVETDGLLVRILPRDESGRVVPVRGTVQVELWGQHWGVVKRAQPYGRIGHWSKPLGIEDFAGHGACLRLPFQSTRPDFAPDLDPRGAVHVRLSVPGQGTFEATDAMLRLRPYSAVRDRLQQGTGQRFFPGELLGASPR